MIKVEKDKTIYIFSEDFEYNKDKPEDSIFGFNIRINCGGIPDFIYMIVKRKDSCKVITTGWEREYQYKNGILTQIYKTKKKSDEVIKTETEISEEKMRLIMDAMWGVYKEDWPKLLDKKQNSNIKTSNTLKNKNNSEIPF